MLEADMHAPTRGRPWLFMAVLAVLSLASTVYVAERALSEARDVVVRGEGDALRSVVAADLAEDAIPPTAELLERELRAREAEGLRYLALVDREGHPVAEAGTPMLRDVGFRPGQATIEGRRVRVSGPLAPPRHLPLRLHGGRPPPMPLLVLELEPPVMERLRGHFLRLAFVAAVAGAVLLAFAFAWSRSATRLAAIEQRAAREQRLVALGSMSSVMAHELRNPLASLKGHAQLLAEDLGGSPKLHAKAERVVREAERLEALTTNLLDFVRDGPIERVEVAPADVVDRAIRDLGRERVEIALERAPASLFVDPVRIARAVHNLVANALEADPVGPVIVAVAREDGHVVFDVSDRGPGLPEGVAIFDPFVTTRARGTGLGLAVARRIAEQHGGTLTGATRPDGGASFRLRFPNAA